MTITQLLLILYCYAGDEDEQRQYAADGGGPAAAAHLRRLGARLLPRLSEPAAQLR